MENSNEKTEKKLRETVKQKEQADKLLLSLETVLSIISLLFLAAMLYIAFVFLQTKIWFSIFMISVGILQFAVAMLFALRIEQMAGYYECQKCRHRYVPKYFSVTMSMHIGRTRYMKCPKCKKASWQKKVISR